MSSNICQSCWSIVDQFHALYLMVERNYEKVLSTEMQLNVVKVEKLEMFDTQCTPEDIVFVSDCDIEVNSDYKDQCGDLSQDRKDNKNVTGICFLSKVSHNMFIYFFEFQNQLHCLKHSENQLQINF